MVIFRYLVTAKERIRRRRGMVFRRGKEKEGKEMKGKKKEEEEDEEDEDERKK